MRTIALIFVLPLLLAFACSRDEDSAGAAPVPEPAAADPGTAAVAAPYAGHDYACTDGLTFNARLDKGNTVVTIDGKTLTLAPAGGAGATYEGEGVTFIARGNDAMLLRAGEPARNCTAK